MALTKQQKTRVIEQIKENLEKQKAIFLIDFQNLKSKELFDLREKLKEIQSLLLVTKKSLIKIAFEQKKIPVNIDELEGQTALVFAFDKELPVLKRIYDFQKEYKSPQILAGLYEGEYLKGEKIIELAELPSREELLARLVGTISGPQSKLVNVLQGNLQSLVYILNQQAGTS